MSTVQIEATTTSTLIQQLTEHLKEYGDMPIYLSKPGYGGLDGSAYLYESIITETYSDGSQKLILSDSISKFETKSGNKNE